MAAVMALDKRQQLVASIALQADPVMNVGAVEAVGEYARLRIKQAGGNFLAGARVGGGGQRQPRHVGKVLAQQIQAQILGPEIVAPLRYTVGFVYGKQADAAAGEQVKRVAAQQALGCNIDQLELPGRQRLLGAALFLGAERGIEHGGGHSVVLQCADLVTHEGDQRRFAYGRAWSDQGGDVVAQGRVSTGGHERERVVEGQHGVNILLVRDAKLPVDKNLR